MTNVGARRKVFLVVALFVSGLSSLAAVLLLTGPFDPFGGGDPVLERIASGRAIYVTHCAACHGKSLEGQPNWQTPLPDGKYPAPPHDATGHTWHHADDVLTGITKRGLLPYAPEGYQSNMPGFTGVLSDDDIAVLWTFIKSTWPERERAHQERITRQKRLQESSQ